MRERLGSGGPRGLQILRSGVKSVRGGFDSHAFPPHARGLGLGLALALVATGAATAAVTRVAAPPESVRVAARTVGLPPPGRFDSPRWVMIRSAILPGWGQLHNGSWLKALALAGVEGTLGYKMVNDADELNRLNAQVEAARAASDADAELQAVIAYNDRQSALVGRQWLFGGVLLYAMMDAYVDAHFRHFDVEFKHDPALPEGVPVRPQARLSYRWSF